MSSMHGENAEEADDYADEEDVELPEDLDVIIGNHDDDDADDSGSSDDGAPMDYDDVHDPTVSPSILENLSDGSDSDGPGRRRPSHRRSGPRHSGPRPLGPSGSDPDDPAPDDPSPGDIDPGDPDPGNPGPDGWDSDGWQSDGVVPRNPYAFIHDLKKENARSIMLVESMMEDATADRKIKSLNQTIRELKKTIATLKGEPTPIVPWSELLRSYIINPSPNTYNHVYRVCCKQENMSMKLDVVHPDFHLLPGQVGDPVLEAYMNRETPSRRHNNPLNDFPRHPPLLEWRPFPFERLPWQIQVKIFRLVFVRRSLVHCLSRLDPYVAPSDFPTHNQENRSQLPKRFHFGTSPCQIRRARRPNDFLRPLLVCKRWYFIGVHAFYGANTFAFSSLGEWHRFCNGISAARVERIANVEIMWHGALMPAQNPQLSLRSIGLAWFMKTKRLRTLVVHIAESVPWRRRRGNETTKRKSGEQMNPRGRRGRRGVEDRGVLDWGKRPNGDLLDEAAFREDQSEEDHSDEGQYDVDEDKELTVVEMLKHRTRYQPNTRKNRSLRTVQGMDYVYQLRGMKWVQFLERDGEEPRQLIRDWTFLQDINNCVTMPKQPHDVLKSDLRNLMPLSGLSDWIPTDIDIHIIEAFYDEYDGSPIVDLVGGSDTSELAGSSSIDGHGSSYGGDGDRNPRGPNNGGGAESDSDSDSDPSDGFDSPFSPYETANTTVPPNSQQINNGQENEHNDVEIMDVDNESEELFVRDGSGSAGDPQPPESEEGLFVPSGSGSVPPSERIVIDLTGEETDDEEDGSSHPGDSSSSFDRVKSETRSETDQDLSNQINDMTLNSDDNGSDDGHRFAREESPPDSEDESDIDTGSDPVSDIRSSPSSSKRASEDGASRDGEERERTPKRPRFV
ncbi:hypothetical protein Hte_001889 [Hypoxylon texense]